MDSREAPRGLIVDLVTPLRADHCVDERALEKMMERVLPHVQGLLLAGPRGGMGASLEASRRRELLEAALGHAAPPTALFVWITGPSPEATRSNLEVLSASLARRGVRGISLYWVDTPLLYHSNRYLAEHYESFSALTDRPFLLYNDPVRVAALRHPLKRKNIRTEILKDLSRLQVVAGMIYEGNLERSRHYLRAVRDGSQFRLYDADEIRFLDYPSRSGVVSLGANLAPAAWAKITASSLHLSGGQKVYPDHLSQLWEAGQHLRDMAQSYAPCAQEAVNHVLSQMGIVPAPSGSAAPEAREAAAHIMRLMKDRGDLPPAQQP